MAHSYRRKRRTTKTRMIPLVFDAVLWVCIVFMVCLILVTGLRESILSFFEERCEIEVLPTGSVRVRRQVQGRLCEEMYVVGEGETLHTISYKCSDPLIIERNPHIHDPDDVFPGLVIRIVPSISRKLKIEVSV